MKVVIIGAGVVGRTLAEDLSRQRHSVSVVESRPELCEEMATQLEVLTVPGEGASPGALEAAGIASADMVIAVTPSDQTNLLVCNLAKQYGVANRIARIVSEEFTSPGATVSLAEIGVTHVIEPEKEVVKCALQYLELPGVTQTANFHSDGVYLRGYRITEEMSICGRTLAETAALAGTHPLLVVAIVRNGSSVPPSGTQTLLAGDEIIAIMRRDSFPTFKKLLGRDTGRLKKVVISGDSLTAVHLAEGLDGLAERVMVIDPDETHAQATAAALTGKADVLYGDCTDADLLQDIQISTADCFIAAGRDTEDNIMSCLLAKAEGAHEVMAINNSDRHARLFQSLGLDRIINPRRITARTILARILRLPIRSYLHLEDVDMSVIRLTAKEGCRMAGKPLRDVGSWLKQSTVLGAILRGEDVIIPNGDTVVEAGDEVILLSKRDSARYVKRLFA